MRWKKGMVMLTALGITACLCSSAFSHILWAKQIKDEEFIQKETQAKDYVKQLLEIDVSSFSEESVEFFEAGLSMTDYALKNETLSKEQLEAHQIFLENLEKSLIQKQEENVVYDGTYTLNGLLHHASMDQASMGDGALKKPFTYIKKGEQSVLHLEVTPMEVLELEGYLGEMAYVPGYKGDMIPSLDEFPAYEVNVLSEFIGVYDVYNNPDTGKDERLRGKEYPKEVEIPVEIGSQELWIRVYVPIMESLYQGSGYQFAKLQMDWSSLKQIEGTERNTEELTKALSMVKELFGQAKGNPEMIKRLLTTVEAGEKDIHAILENLNVDQSGVDATVHAFNALGNVMTLMDGEQEQNDSDLEQKDPQEKDENKEKKNPDEFDLEDGIYVIHGAMVKTDKITSSMADGAINHNIMLQVEGKKPVVVMQFGGLEINGKYGYLGVLKYFESGYGFNAYGLPRGTVSPAKVESVHKNENGEIIKDRLGTDYPSVASFPLIKEAKEEGWVPLQVFVPIMESISKGTGTQAVYLKLDWNTLKKTTADDPAFQMKSKKVSEEGNNQKGQPSLLADENLIKSTQENLGNSKDTGGFGSGIKAGGLGNGGKKATVKPSAGGKKLGNKLSGAKKPEGEKATGLKNDLSVKKEQKPAMASNLKEVKTVGERKTMDGAGRKGLETPAVVTMSICVLGALAGVLYKLRSRRIGVFGK